MRGFGVTGPVAAAKGEHRHGEQGRFGGAQRSRNRLARIVYLDALDLNEFGACCCVYALKTGLRATLA